MIKQKMCWVKGQTKAEARNQSKDAWDFRLIEKKKPGRMGWEAEEQVGAGLCTIVPHCVYSY